MYAVNCDTNIARNLISGVDVLHCLLPFSDGKYLLVVLHFKVHRAT